MVALDEKYKTGQTRNSPPKLWILSNSYFFARNVSKTLKLSKVPFDPVTVVKLDVVAIRFAMVVEVELDLK